MTEPLNNKIDQFTDDILASYKVDSETQRVGEMDLPSREEIVRIIDEIRQLLFPGYIGHQQLSWQNVKFHVGNLLTRLAGDLGNQIRQCMCMMGECGHDHQPDCPEIPQCHDKAADITCKLIEQIPHLREILSLDAQAAYDGDPAAKQIDEIVYCYPGFYAVTVYRIAHELEDLGVPLMPRIMTEHAHTVTGADIHPGAEIGKSFFIDHATGVVIGETADIGDNVKLYQGVTLGALSFPKDERGRIIKGTKRHPTIQDDVTIYANATILGGDTIIGQGVIVGGNTYVTHSIMAESTVVGEAPKLKVRTNKADG